MCVAWTQSLTQGTEDLHLLLHALLIVDIMSVIRFYDNYDNVARGETLGQTISGEDNTEAKTKVNLQGVLYDRHGIDPINDTRLDTEEKPFHHHTVKDVCN